MAYSIWKSTAGLESRPRAREAQCQSCAGIQSKRKETPSTTILSANVRAVEPATLVVRLPPEVRKRRTEAGDVMRRVMRRQVIYSIWCLFHWRNQL